MMVQKNKIHKHNTRKVQLTSFFCGETTYNYLSLNAIRIWDYYMLRHISIHISYENFKRLTKDLIQENNINYKMMY